MHKTNLPVGKDEKIVSVPTIVLNQMRSHRSDLVRTWEEFWWHFQTRRYDCYEVWCRLQIQGSYSKHMPEQISKFLEHVGQLPGSWNDISSHADMCEECEQYEIELAIEAIEHLMGD